MLAEMLSASLTRCAPGARALGYAYGQAALVARYRRNRQAWAPHLARTRHHILAAADDVVSPDETRTERRGAALILGSGALLDIPLAGLARRFARVILADIAHPPVARFAAWRHPNVSLAVVDLTGLVGPLAACPLADQGWPHIADGDGGLPITDFLDDPAISLVVSANILSQLALAPMAAPGQADAPSPRTLGAAIVAGHLAYLSAFAAPRLLVTDINRQIIDMPGLAPRQEDPLFGVPPPPAFDRWIWPVAPTRERADGKIIETEVAACRF